MYTFYDTHPKDVPTTGTLPVEALTVDGITIGNSRISDVASYWT